MSDSVRRHSWSKHLRTRAKSVGTAKTRTRQAQLKREVKQAVDTRTGASGLLSRFDQLGPRPESTVLAERVSGGFVKSAVLPGAIQGEVYGEGPRFTLSGDADLTRKGMGVDIDVNLKVDANLLQAGAGATREFRFQVNGEEVAVRVRLGADAQVAATGELKLKIHVGKDGFSIKAGAEGFAGARGTLSGSIETSVNGKQIAAGALNLTAAAAVMGAASLDVSRNAFRMKAYAAVGVGMGIDVAGQWDMAQAMKSGAALALPGNQGW